MKKNISLVMFLGFIFADNIYVPDDFSSINEAVNFISVFDTIFVTEGIYNESISINQPMSLIGNVGVIINGSGYNSVINIESDSVLVQGFEIIGDTLTVGGIIVKPGSEYITLKGNVIHGMKLPNQSSQLLASYGILSYGDSNGPPNPPRNLVIENNEIYNINAFGISLGSFSDSVFIKNNYIHDIDRIDLSPYGYDEDLSVGVIAQFGGWIQIEDNNFSNVLLGSNLLFSYGEVSDNTYDDSTKIYLAYNDTNPINIPSRSLPQNASASKFGEFGGISGTVVAHLKNVQDAIDYADNMTEINVTSGTFYENINISGKNISLIGEDPMNTVLHSNYDSSPIIDLDSTDVVIKGFTVVSGGYGIYSMNNTNSAFEDLLVMSTSDSLSSILFSNSNSTLNNVTIVDNHGGMFIENSSISILNSIINSEIISVDSSYIDITYSNIFGGFEGEGNINENPLFCKPDDNDFTLAENSPCLGSGFEGSNMGVFDIGCNSALLGDINGDGNIDVLDIVAGTNHVLGCTDPLSGFEIFSGDINQDGILDILDLSLIFHLILDTQTQFASEVLLLHNENEIYFEDDGFVSAFKIILGHGEDFLIELTNNALISEYCTNGDTTSIVIIAPNSNDLIMTTSEFTILEAVAVALDQYIELSMNELDIDDIVYLGNYELKNIYPNPFNPITTISYIIPEPNDLIISIYDINGNSIEILKDEYTYPGEYNIEWNGQNFPSGIYFVNIQTDNFNKTRKLMLIQ